MTLNEIITILAERVGRQFDQAFKRELRVIVMVWRSRIMRQTLERNPLDRQFFKDGFLLDLEEVSITECPELAGQSCTVLRSVKTIPRPVRASGIVFDYIGTDDFLQPFDRIQMWYYRFKKTSPVTGDRAKYAYKNNRIYIVNNTLIERIAVEGVFEDPRSVYEMQCDDTAGVKCASDDMDFNTSLEVGQAIIQAILATELRALVKGETPEVKVTPQ